MANLKQLISPDQCIASLQAEIVNLKTETPISAKEIRIYLTSCPSVRRKIKDIENEKRSLITSLRLLQSDSNSDLEKLCQNETESELGDETIQANPPSSDQPETATSEGATARPQNGQQLNMAHLI
ncbi:Hypothetical predicted protein [Paramuricea clavata]|uniref:Uncharacterized protein n=1 Tax=Paramuricea clavata TaxID=317549 RepID=A0A7D9IMS7_PARCT|nr:Hypothetical predicted protein [Paramuricea clavata]